MGANSEVRSRGSIASTGDARNRFVTNLAEACLGDGASGEPAVAPEELAYRVMTVVLAWPSLIGEVVVDSGRVEATVVAMVRAGADVGEILDALVVAGSVEMRSRRFAWLLSRVNRRVRPRVYARVRL